MHEKNKSLRGENKNLKNERKKEKNFTKKSILNIIIILIYSIIMVIASLHHEAWGDETQAWLIAKELSFRRDI